MVGTCIMCIHLYGSFFSTVPTLSLNILQMYSYCGLNPRRTLGQIYVHNYTPLHFFTTAVYLAGNPLICLYNVMYIDFYFVDKEILFICFYRNIIFVICTSLLKYPYIQWCTLQLME